MSIHSQQLDIKSKLHLYKTAFSPTYDRYVEILEVREDDNGEPIIKARVPKRESPGPGYVLFRVCELQDWCL